MGVSDERQWFFVPLTGMEGVILLQSFPVLVGSGADCDIRVSAPGLAPVHVEISAKGHDLVVRDVSGSGLLTLNGAAVESAAVHHRLGARFSAGQFTFWLCFETVADAKRRQRSLIAAASSAPAAPSAGGPNWWFSRGGTVHGPAALDTLRQMAAAAELAPDDLVWRDGEAVSRRARDLPELGFRAAAQPAAPAPLDPGRGAPAAGAPLEPAATADTAGYGGVWTPNPAGGEITCPHCWWEFGLHDMLAVGRGPNLLGDTVLGRGEYRRFLPTRFAGNGNPIDPDGVESREWACPRCHLVLPSTLRTARTFFLSIVGASGSGKSYFLAAMSWRLKELMPARFGCEFLDLDVRANEWLSHYEEALFLAVDEDAPQKINKTDIRGDQYRPVMLGGQQVLLPRPCLFKVKPLQGAAPTAAEDASRLLVCYDNAGEHFQPDHDSATEPGTEHIARAGGIVFMVDPILDVGLRRAVVQAGGTVASGLQTYAQHNLLNETFNRIRRLRGVSADGVYEKPFIVCLSKADVFPAEFDLSSEPWVWSSAPGAYALDLAQVVAMSFRVRAFLSTHAPRLVRTAEAFARHVLYVPVSGLGHCPGRHRGADGAGVRVESFGEAVRPRDIRPGWVEVPLLYILACLGDIRAQRGGHEDALTVEQYHVNGGMVRAVLPGRAEPLDIPVCYGGHAVQIPGTTTWLRVPRIAGAESL